MAYNSCYGGGNNTCMWTLIIIAIVFVWLNCFGGSIGGGCGCNDNCGCNPCNPCC